MFCLSIKALNIYLWSLKANKSNKLHKKRLNLVLPVNNFPVTFWNIILLTQTYIHRKIKIKTPLFYSRVKQIVNLVIQTIYDAERPSAFLPIALFVVFFGVINAFVWQCLGLFYISCMTRSKQKEPSNNKFVLTKITDLGTFIHNVFS